MRVLSALVLMCSLSACELIADFDRGKLDSGVGDSGAGDDAGEVLANEQDGTPE